VSDRETRQLVVGALITLAIGGNGFFISRLVNKIDRVDDIERRLISLQSDVNIIKSRLGFAEYKDAFGPKEEGS
jgi:hypothetical protein